MCQQAVIGFLLLSLTLQTEQAGEGSCQNTVLTATESDQRFEVYKMAELIPENYKCTWTIKGDGKKGISVYLAMFNNPPNNQCVKVGGSQTICSNDEYPLVVVYGNETEVTYPAKSGLKDVKSFGIYYALRNQFSCGPAVLTAKHSKQTFRVNTESEIILDGYKCNWVVTGHNRSIEVFIEKGSIPDQCVIVTNGGIQTETLCATTSKTYYKSSTSPVYLSFPGKEYTTPLLDFSVTYKLAAANRRAPIFLTIGLFYVLIQL